LEAASRFARTATRGACSSSRTCIIMTDRQYPIGRFHAPDPVTEAHRSVAIADIEALPVLLREAMEDGTSAHLDVRYRPGGWTLRQVVHHLADSHLNAYIRFKLALTEDEPTIKPYDESSWAELPDSRLHPDVSLQLLEGLHGRWTALLRSMDDADFARGFFHPELAGVKRLDHVLMMYAWHGKHHLAHVRLAVSAGTDR
jgi:hypothetical protein